MNNSNLRNLKELTKEERQEIVTKGGKASVQAKRERAKLKECFSILNTLGISKAEQEQ